MAYKEIEKLADEIYNDCKKMRMTLGEFRKLARMLLGKASSIQEENEKSALDKILD